MLDLFVKSSNLGRQGKLHFGHAGFEYTQVRMPSKYTIALASQDGPDCFMTSVEGAQAAICRDLFGKDPDSVLFPGGKGRQTFIAVMDGEHFAVSRRSGKGRATLEAEVLHRLGNTGLVPRLLRRKGALLAQEYVPGKRLTLALYEATATQQPDLLYAAAESLIDIRRAAEKAGLLRIVPKIGVREGWLDDLMQLPARIAAEHGADMPWLDYVALRERITPHREAFVKWDARAGNAMLRPDGTMCWFDWEHCGRRSPFDDAVWLLADEWSPDCPDAEERALRALTEDSSLSGSDVASRFYAMAVLHSFVRLSLILSRKPAQGWWSHDACLRYDKIGVTHLHFTRVCSRGARWAQQSDVLRPFVRLFADLASAIPAG